jgi:hypothetical protein
MKFKRRLNAREATTQRKFYKAVREGMDYDKAFDLIIEKHFDDVFGQIIEDSYTEGGMNINIPDEKKLYELDEENYTITEII